MLFRYVMERSAVSHFENGPEAFDAVGTRYAANEFGDRVVYSLVGVIREQHRPRLGISGAQNAGRGPPVFRPLRVVTGVLPTATRPVMPRHLTLLMFFRFQPIQVSPASLGAKKDANKGSRKEAY